MVLMGDLHSFWPNVITTSLTAFIQGDSDEPVPENTPSLRIFVGVV